MLHINQAKILELAKRVNLTDLTLKQIAEQSGIKNASKQLISFHIEKLKKKGFLNLNSKIKKEDHNLISLPFYGTANGGPSTYLAEDQIQGYVKISKSILNGDKKRFFCIKITGNSMNKERIHEKEVKDGAYLIVEKTSNPVDKDVVVTIVDGLVNIKKYKKVDNDTIALLSNSTEEYPPIFLGQADDPYIVGKVVKVIGTADIE